MLMAGSAAAASALPAEVGGVGRDRGPVAPIAISAASPFQ